MTTRSTPPTTLRLSQRVERLLDLRSRWSFLAEASLSNVKDFVNHIDYAVKLIEIDHIGISSDFDGGGGIDGRNSAAEAFNVTLELVRRDYTDNAP